MANPAMGRGFQRVSRQPKKATAPPKFVGKLAKLGGVFHQSWYQVVGASEHGSETGVPSVPNPSLYGYAAFTAHDWHRKTDSAFAGRINWVSASRFQVGCPRTTWISRSRLANPSRSLGRLARKDGRSRFQFSLGWKSSVGLRLAPRVHRDPLSLRLKTRICQLPKHPPKLER